MGFRELSCAVETGSPIANDQGRRSYAPGCHLKVTLSSDSPVNRHTLYVTFYAANPKGVKTLSLSRRTLQWSSFSPP